MKIMDSIVSKYVCHV